jgi:hypothetical protein
MSESNYPERFCAYIDILGFRGYVASLRANSSNVTQLKNTLEMVHRPVHLGLADLDALQYRTQSISDAVAISVVPTVEGLLELFSTISFLVTALLASGYFVRGAITKGRLFHDDTIVFGEALIKAYDLEQTVVRYPRIMVPTEVVQVLNRDDGPALGARRWLGFAEDGPMFVHVLRRMQEDLASPARPTEGAHDPGRYGWIREMIINRFQEAVDNPRHFEKVRWFAQYWNKSLPTTASNLRILGPGLN